MIILHFGIIFKADELIITERGTMKSRDAVTVQRRKVMVPKGLAKAPRAVVSSALDAWLALENRIPSIVLQP